jgi:hypothetical protein
VKRKARGNKETTKTIIEREQITECRFGVSAPVEATAGSYQLL